MLRLARPHHPFELFDELLRGPLARPAARSRSSLTVLADDEGVTLRAPLPGLDPATIDVSIERDRLRIVAERPAPAGDDDRARVILRELPAEPVDLSLRLGFAPDADGVHAGYERGVLTIRVPRSRAELPRRVPVSTTA